MRLGFGSFAVVSVASFLAAANLSSCGRTDKPDSDSNSQQGSRYSGLDQLSSDGDGIYAHSSVPQDQRDLLKTDFSRLARLNLSGASDGELASILGTNDLSGAGLAHWLGARAHYIVGNDFSPNLVSEVATDRHYTPHVYGREAGASWDDTRNVVVIMVNLGTAIYSAGRDHDRLYSVNLDGNEVSVDSPRVGLIQIGEGLFRSFYHIDNHGLDSMGTTLDRLSVLFHEARHSDGNGKNAGFPHETCPPGHEYAGREQCDSASNGAFALEAALLKTFIRTCEQSGICDAAEIEALRLSYADARIRLVGHLEQRDSRPERVDSGR